MEPKFVVFYLVIGIAYSIITLLIKLATVNAIFEFDRESGEKMKRAITSAPYLFVYFIVNTFLFPLLFVVEICNFALMTLVNALMKR